MTPLLRIEGLSKRFGGVTAVDAVSLDIAQGELHALIGPNGAGKTTLIHVLSGALPASSGRAVFDGVDVTHLPMHARVRSGLARSYQITSLFPNFTVLENLALALQPQRGHLFTAWQPVAGDETLFAQAQTQAQETGLAGRVDTLAGELAHGERRLLEIGLALATGARLLLLDEPMAGLGPDESQRLLQLLQSLKGRLTVLLVEHDMDAVFRLADRISTLVYGRIVATGTPEAIRAHPEVRRAYLGESAA
ncbi:MAG: ABC transporter ATP-binding protein [Alphaproteobacteria bacterium]|nr:ABC transporter ATP-binding protein [Alphaproteobacteria bacterium]